MPEMANDFILLYSILNLFIFILNSNIARLCSQWLNSVIYWMRNHYTNKLDVIYRRFCHQFDVYDVDYPIRPYNIDIRWRKFVLTANDCSKRT